VIETHPFGSFVPPNTQYLFLGTFVVKITDASYDWFFSSKRNQFWQIMGQVYEVKLRNKEEKQALFSKLKMAITDVIWACERSQNTNADNNLVNLVFNTKSINEIVRKNKIKKIFFSSRYAEILFKRNFKEITKQHPQIELVTLPSSSPRFAAMSKVEKIIRYKKLLPKLID
jgi:hypoxanthine-DNA glycosylase